MEEKRNKKNIVSLIVLCVSIVALTTSLTYAYFVSQIGTNDSEQVTITSGTLSLTFRDNDETVENIEGSWNFGDTIKKELVIENTGTKDTYAKISWDNLINTYLAESLTYTLEEKTDEEGSTWKTVETESTNVPRSETASTVALADHLFIPAGHTYTYRLKVTLEYLDDVEQSNDLTANFVTKFTITESTKREPTAREILLAKANDVSVIDYSSGETGEMYTFEHDEANQTTGWSVEERRDYRYIGANPNNWIKFNDEDWRIIGVFTVEKTDGTKEQLIKIIRNESIGNIAWDSNNVNEWPSSSLKTLLNEGDYYNRVNTYASTGLNETARNQIAEVKWYLGGSSNYSGLGGPAYYSFERGTSVYSGRSTNTTGKVGLMYPSDYIYTYANGVDNTCYTNGNNCQTSSGANPANGWLYNSSITQWTISPNAGNSMRAFYVYSSGYVSNYIVSDTFAARPSLYLASDIEIISGDGASSETAYQIE